MTTPENQIFTVRETHGRVLRTENRLIAHSEETTEWQHSGHPEILQVYLRQSIYAAAVDEMYDCDISAAEIVPRFAILDPLLEQLAVAITAALRDGSVDDGLYVDTI